MEIINQFFWLCVEAIKWFGDLTGMGYNLANIVVFVIFQPEWLFYSFYYGEGKLEEISTVEQKDTSARVTLD